MVTIIKYAFRVRGIQNWISVLDSELSYFIKRILLRIKMGKKKRNAWLSDHQESPLSKITKKEILIKNEQGLKYWIRPTDWDFFVVSTKCEPVVLSKFTPKEGDVVLDLGANIGKYSIHCGNLVGKKGKVFAFEPSKRPFELLCKSIKENNLNEIVTPICCAVSDKDGKSKLYSSDDEPLTSLVYKLSNNYTEVDTISIDSFVSSKKIKRIDWLKVDVEGAEYDVLSGAIQTLQNNNVKLIFEVLKVNRDKVLELLESIGYYSYQLESYHTETFTKEGSFNFLAQKNKP